MHNTSVKNVVSTESAPLKVISVVRLNFRTQLRISSACSILISGDGEEDQLQFCNSLARRHLVYYLKHVLSQWKVDVNACFKRRHQILDRQS